MVFNITKMYRVNSSKVIRVLIYLTSIFSYDVLVCHEFNWKNYYKYKKQNSLNANIRWLQIASYSPFDGNHRYDWVFLLPVQVSHIFLNLGLISVLEWFLPFHSSFVCNMK